METWNVYRLHLDLPPQFLGTVQDYTQSQAFYHALEVYGQGDPSESLEVKYAPEALPDDEQALRCAAEQAAKDIPYVEVTDTAIYRKIVQEDRKIAPNEAQALSATGDRWYVEVGLKHPGDESTAMALYRVWRTPTGWLQAMKVDIR